MLLALVLDFESHRGEILNLFSKNKERTRINCCERLAWVGTGRVGSILGDHHFSRWKKGEGRFLFLAYEGRGLNPGGFQKTQRSA